MKGWSGKGGNPNRADHYKRACTSCGAELAGNVWRYAHPLAPRVELCGGCANRHRNINALEVVALDDLVPHDELGDALRRITT